MARIPTTYTTGMATSANLQAPSAVRVPADLGQEIPRALMNFGQTLEKVMFADVRMEQDEEYRNNVGKFREDLATTHADLLKKKEDIDNSADPMEVKNKKFSEYAMEKQDKLFSSAPKHIVQDYKSQFINMVTPIELQVANNAQAAQALQIHTNMIVKFDQAQADIDAIAASKGTPEQRKAEFDEYIKQQASDLLTGADKLGAAGRERLTGQIEALKSRAYDRFVQKMNESTQMEARVSLDGLVQTTLNSPSAAQDPAGTAQTLKDAIAQYGGKTGLTAMQIQDLTQKVTSDAWNNSVISRATQNANEKYSLGQQIALDRKLVAELTAQKDNQYLYGGIEYDIKDRNARVAFLQNRIESNMNAMRAEALKRANEKAVSYFQQASDPLQARADQLKVKLVPIDMSNPAGSLIARVKQMKMLGADVPLTAKEAESLGTHFMKMKTPQEAFGWLDGLTKGVDPTLASNVLGLIKGQVGTSAPQASRAIDLWGSGFPMQAMTYYTQKQTQRIDGSNTELKRNYDTHVNKVRNKYGSVLPASSTEALGDIIATLALQPGADASKIEKELIGTKQTTGRFNPLVPNFDYLVPPKQNGDRIANFFKNPSTDFLKVTGVAADKIKQSKPVYTSTGYLMTNPANGEPVPDKNGNPLFVPFSMFGGK